MKNSSKSKYLLTELFKIHFPYNALTCMTISNNFKPCIYLYAMCICKKTANFRQKCKYKKKILKKKNESAISRQANVQRKINVRRSFETGHFFQLYLYTFGWTWGTLMKRILSLIKKKNNNKNKTPTYKFCVFFK